MTGRNRRSVLSDNARSWGLTYRMTYADGYEAVKATLIKRIASVLRKNGWKTAVLSFEYEWNVNNDNEDNSWSLCADVGLLVSGTKKSEKEACVSLYWSDHKGQIDTENGFYPTGIKDGDKDCLHSIQESLLQAFQLFGAFLNFQQRETWIILA